MSYQSPREQAKDELNHLSPKSHIKGFSFTKEEASKLPKTLVCETHGEFETKFNVMYNQKVWVGSCCNKCVEEFDLLVDQKEKEVEQKREEAATIKEQERRIEMLSEIGVSKRYINNSFDNYATETPEKQNALSKCLDLSNRIKSGESAPNLIMVGGVGTGKTHLANSVIIDLYDNGKRAERVNMIDMIRTLKSSWSKDSEYSEDKLIGYYTNIDLLVIDEVGIQFNSDTEKMFIFDIINGRYDNCLPTMIISNLDINGVKEILGERCIDRLRQDGGKVIAFNWESYRSN